MRHLPPRLLDHIGHAPRGAAILDMGAGDGQLARRLLEVRPDLRITGVDLGARSDGAIPVVACDGARLPFADRTFDLVMLIDVLHHAKDPAPLLREALRATKGRVLIKDHHWVTRLDHWLLSASDYLGNRIHGVPLPYAFLRLGEWARLFQACDAVAVTQDRFVYGGLDRCKQVIFMIEAGQPAPSDPSKEPPR